MLIASSSIVMSGQHQKTRTSEVAEKITMPSNSSDSIRADRQGSENLEPRQNSINVQTDIDLRTIASRLTDASLSLQSRPNLLGHTDVSDDPEHAMQGLDAKTYTLKTLVETLTGKSLDLAAVRSYWQEIAKNRSEASETNSPQNHTAILHYQRLESLKETEHTEFHAKGTISTQDGREINFELDTLLEREYQEQRYFSAYMTTEQLIDPLVLNLDNTTATLSDSRYRFDLDADGQQEQIHFVDTGSAFLAIDRNNNNLIDNGNELFGPMTGNAYQELARYDEDGNMFIDAGDSVFQHLTLWQKDANGQDTLQSLASAGIGALYLNSISTPFDLKDHENSLQGTMRQSSVFVRDNGEVGTTHQIDLAI
ncbi:MAG: hypothetical protein ACFHVJ_00685 [Aestuariibacter sp.]